MRLTERRSKTMKSIKGLVSASVGLAVTAAVVLAIGFSGNAKAISCFQYDPSGNFQTSQTPVFNNICGDPTLIPSTQGGTPIGNESNFVRIRQDVAGDTSNANNPSLVSNLTAACNAGDKFDICTYIHNDAMTQFNNNGSGTAVAHGVNLTTQAPLNTSANQ